MRTNELIRLLRGLSLVALLAIAAPAHQLRAAQPPAPPPARPAGVITGVVLDGRGMPVRRVTVHALTDVSIPNPTGITLAGTSGQTDEAGRFRLTGIRPGEYLVAVVPPPPFILSSDSAGLAYAVTYHPSTADPRVAQRVPVAAGDEVTLVIELQRVQGYRVSGSVTTPSGRSTAGVRVELRQQLGGANFSRLQSIVQKDGAFEIAAVPAGRYALLAATPGFLSDPSTKFALLEIALVDRDIEGIALTLGTGASVAGRMVVEGGAPGPPPLGLRVAASSNYSSGMFSKPAWASVAEDWTFLLSGLSGVYRFTASTTAPPGYRTTRVLLNGKDLPATGAELRSGQHQLVIVMAPR